MSNKDGEEAVVLQMVGVPEMIRTGLRPYRDLFRRSEGCEYVSRYVAGLMVSPMIRLDVKVHFGLVPHSPPRAPDQDGEHFGGA